VLRGSCLLTPIDCIGDSNFLFVGCLKKKMRTDKLFSLHSFITVTWFVVYALLSSLRSTMSYYSLWLCLRQTTDSKGRLVDLLLTVAKLPPTLEACGINSRAHPNKTLFHYAPFFMRKFVALSCGFLPPPATLKEIRNVARPQGFIKQGKRLRGSASLIRHRRMRDRASQAVS